MRSSRLNLRADEYTYTIEFRDGISPLERQFRCGMSSTRRITPMLGLLPLGGAGLSPWVWGPFQSTHPICRWVVSQLQAILMHVPKRIRPHMSRNTTRIQPHVVGLYPNFRPFLCMSRYIYEGFLDWIIPSTYQPHVDVL